MPISKNFILKELRGEFMILPLTGTGVDTTKVFTINESAAFIYKALKDDKTIDEISELMLKEYEGITKEIALNDINEFVDILRQKGIYND